MTLELHLDRQHLEMEPLILQRQKATTLVLLILQAHQDLVVDLQVLMKMPTPNLLPLTVIQLVVVQANHLSLPARLLPADLNRR